MFDLNETAVDMESSEEDYSGKDARFILGERHFRRVKDFDGDRLKYRSFLFKVFTIIGRLDKKLAGELESSIKTDDGKENPDNWKFETDGFDSGKSKYCHATPRNFSGC